LATKSKIFLKMTTSGDQELSSQLLFQRYRSGDPHAAEELLDRYLTRLLAVVRQRMSAGLKQRLDEEDVAQSAFHSFFRLLSNEQTVLRRAGDMWRLLATIGLNKLRRQVEFHTASKRAYTNDISADENLLPTNIDQHPLPGDELVLIDELEIVLDQCNNSEGTALTLRLSGETIEEIAKAMNRSHRTVRRLLQTAREKLQRRLNE
jgi:RNA polymerase sigma factor (sigma-70 family)